MFSLRMILGRSALIAPLMLVGTVAAQDAGRVESSRAGDSPPASKPADPPAGSPTPAEQFRQIKADWEAATGRWGVEAEKAKTADEEKAVFARLYPNELDYYRRCLDLAEAHPKDLAARDALLWVVSDGMRNNDAVGERKVPIGRAVAILVRDFADDPRVARAALYIDNITSPNRTDFCRGLFDRATNREAKGLACLALAQILGKDAGDIAWARKNEVQPKMRFQMRDDAGKPYFKEGPPRFEDAYYQSLRSRDEAATRAESEALYLRVIDEYGDVPYNPWHYVDGKVAANPHPKPLAEVAEGKLDDLHNLAVGKPAPDFEGVGLDGKPMKLSDHKGKAVLLVFWFAGCGPCMAAVPQERDLVEKLKGRPFVLLGVNNDEKLEAARKAAGDTGMTWPSLRDGRPDDGPIANRYHVRGYPTVFLIDADGKIRTKGAAPVGLEEAVEKLVVEAEMKPAP